MWAGPMITGFSAYKMEKHFVKLQNLEGFTQQCLFPISKHDIIKKINSGKRGCSALLTNMNKFI